MIEIQKERKYKKSIFVFRRDLRLEDNLGLYLALKNSEKVIPVFIYDEKLSKGLKKSEFRWNFLRESLVDLDLHLKKKKSHLAVYEGNPTKITKQIILEENIESVFSNTDFSNYSKKRNSEVNKICRENNADFNCSLDFLLHNPNEIKTDKGKPYTIYSHFVKKARQFPVRKILKNTHKNYFSKSQDENKIKSIEINKGQFLGGRNAALEILNNLKEFKNYKNQRDYPFLNQTTKLSAHNKFGTVSIREILQALKNNLGKDHMLISQIYWREFYHHILYHFPYSKNQSFKEKYGKIRWSKSHELFNSWCKGMTGFPIVDAGMRELTQTGFMHNRVRMIVASFLTKDLHIDWRWGEKFFAEKLIDYDPAVNAGNWQWSASTGCDAVPYFRIFNPWRQQEQFDPKCEYVKKWIPELRDFSPNEIHKLWEKTPKNCKYPIPIIDHKTESDKSKKIFKKILSDG